MSRKRMFSGKKSDLNVWIALERKPRVFSNDEGCFMIYKYFIDFGAGNK